METSITQIDLYESFKFSAPTAQGNTIQHTVYHRGSGPPVVLIQELPGIGQETLRLADELVRSGFEVIMPHLFGPLGKTSLTANLIRVFCLRREFTLFTANKTSPIVDWLKALCKKIRKDRRVTGVGVIGMCLTGNFAISLMADDSVLAVVASQPAMPFGKLNALHMSATDIDAIKSRIAVTAPIKAFRFDQDPLCDARKFARIDGEFNKEGVNRVDLSVLPGKGHSVFTLDFVNQEGEPTRAALDEVVEYFTAQLS